MVELCGLCRETRFDVAQAFPVGELSKGHTTKLPGTTQGSNAVIAAVTRDDPGKGRPRQEVHELSEQRLAGVHRSLRGSGPRKRVRNGIGGSNRHHPFSPLTQCQTWNFRNLQLS